MLKPPLDWFTLLSTFKGVGPKLTEKLAQLGIKTCGDLLLHFPHRYENKTKLTPIINAPLENGIVVQGRVHQIKFEGKAKKRALITLQDNTGTLTLLFFHFHPSFFKKMQENTILRCFGQVTASKNGIQMIHPEWEIIESEVPMPKTLTPIYPAVSGLSQHFLRKMITLLLETLDDAYQDIFVQKLPSLGQALKTVHQPMPSDMQALISRIHPAYQRLICEELLAQHISLTRLKAATNLHKAFAFKVNNHPHRFLQRLPFKLTEAQKRVWQEIQTSLTLTRPMLRLLQGDVGSGKTVIAALSALMAISNQCQVALMAPTEILAEQHFIQFQTWFTPLGFRCDILTSKLKAKTKRSLLENITMGLTNLVIGTQAIFQEDVLFKELGLVIIDEQHRFGVHQRLALGKKGQNALNPCFPHQLIMTATPIPRTLMMSHYAHLDISIIDSLPPNRLPIITLAIPQSRRLEVIERIKSICTSGQQVYWVCTLIDENESLQCQAAQKALQLLQEALAYRVALVHGQMDAFEKESIMQAFYQGDITVLVATTVIEVGVNVPNATLMVIENPERLGLAQLHQLRGRIGRGNKASYCILLYGTPLSDMAKSRLQLMRQTQDGFVIAEADLALRGPGELLGVRQTGALEFKVACLVRDKALLEHLSDWANDLSKEMSEQELLQMMRRWGVASEEVMP